MRDQDLPLLDENLAQAPADLRHDLAVAASNDLYFFAKGILGYRDMTEACHGPFCTFLDKHPARFKLALQPRGHYKTSVGTVSRPLQKLTQNAEHRILIANETAENAEGFLGAIKNHVEGNRRFRALYSGLIPPDIRKVKWSQHALEFKREGSYVEPSISAIGMTGAWTSRHYTHIDFDDPISEEAAKSERVMQDVITRISKVFSLMTDVENDTFDLIGTRWAFYDVYSYMVQWLGEEMAQFVRGAIEDGQPIFPQKFSLGRLATIRDAPTMGEYSFSCQYMNNPRNVELQDFNVQDLRFWRWSRDEANVVLYASDGTIHEIVPVEKLDITVTVDLAPAEKITSDRNAVTVTGTTTFGDVIVLEAWARRCTPLELIDKLFGVKQRYTPRVFGIESVGYQKAFKYFLTAEATRREAYLNIFEIKAIGKKEIRIRGLQPIAATGHLYIDPRQHELRNEFADFPLGQYDDLVDSLSMHLQLWRGPVSAKRWNKVTEERHRLLRDIDGYGLRSDRLAPAYGGFGPRHPRDIPHPDDLGVEPAQAPIYAVEVG